jgi:hypothetical protein
MCIPGVEDVHGAWARPCQTTADGCRAQNSMSGRCRNPRSSARSMSWSSPATSTSRSAASSGRSCTISVSTPGGFLSVYGRAQSDVRSSTIQPETLGEFKAALGKATALPDNALNAVSEAEFSKAASSSTCLVKCAFPPGLRYRLTEAQASTHAIYQAAASPPRRRLPCRARIPADRLVLHVLSSSSHSPEQAAAFTTR